MDQVGTGHPSFELLSAYHDAETAPAEHQRIGAHLDWCAACRKTLSGFDLLGMAIRAVPVLGCADLTRSLSAELDGEASSEETLVVAAHLQACASCRAQRASWLTLDAAIAALPAGVPGAAADGRIRGLTHRRRWIIPSGPAFRGGIVGRAAAILVAVALALVASLPRGATLAPPVGVGEDRPLVASVQQVLNARTNTLYVLRADLAVVLAKNATTNAELASIAVGGSPTALALNEAANLVYVLDPTAKTYTTISGSTNTVTAIASVPLTGTLTSIQVNATTGQLVIGATASAAPSAAPSGPLGQLAIIDPASQKVETRTVDVAPTQVVLNAAANRIYLLGAKGTSVVDATTYATIATLPVAVAVAASATGGADAILSSDGGKAKLSFYGTANGTTFDGTPVNAVGLPDGSFAVLLDVAGSGRIQLVDRLGGAIGSLDVAGTTKALTFDPDARRFLGANGQVVASIVGTSIAIVVPATAEPPRASAAPPALPGVPNASKPASPTAVLPVPTAVTTPVITTDPLPGAVAAAAGIDRLDLAGIVPIAIATDSSGRLWFVSDEGTLSAIDTSTGVITNFARVSSRGSRVLLATGASYVFVTDRDRGTVTWVDSTNSRVRVAQVPFGSSVTTTSAALDGTLWLSTISAPGLLHLDPTSASFSIVPLPAGSIPMAVATDKAGVVWFSDAGRGVVGAYESVLRRFTEVRSPTRGPVTHIDVDPSGQAWFSTLAGEAFSWQGGSIVGPLSVPGPLAATAAGKSGTWYATDGATAGVGRFGQRGSITGPANVLAIAVDSRGRLWIASAGTAALFILER